MTKEQEITSRKNKYRTKKIMNVPKGFDLHHKDPSWKSNNVERYIQWNPDDLIIMSHSEHSSWHRINTPLNYSIISEKNKKYSHKHSEETKLKMSASRKGVKHNKEWNEKVAQANRGRKASEETKKKLSESHTGYHWKVVDGKRVFWREEKEAI